MNMSLRLRLGLILLSIGCWGGVGWATEGDLTMRPSTEGLGGFFADGKWSQRQIILQNLTDKERRVRVTYEAVATGGDRTRYYRAFALPPRCERFGYLSLLPASNSKSSDTVKDMSFYEENFQLEDPDTGILIEKPSHKTLKLPEAATTILISADKTEANDTQAYLHELKGADLGQVQQMLCNPKALPDKWYALSSLRILFLGQTDLSQLRSSQVEAMLDWVADGGVLVLTGSRQMPQMLQSPLGAAAGVAGVSTHQVEGLTFGAQSDFQPVKLGSPMTMVELCPDTATTLVTANGLPLLTRHRLARGWVFCLAVPLGAVADESLHGLWKHVNRAMNTVPPIDPKAFAVIPTTKPSTDGRPEVSQPTIPPGRLAIENIAGRPAPHRVVPVAIMAGMAGLTLVGGALLRLRRRGELLWVGLIPLAVIVGIGFYIYGGSRIPQEQLMYVGLLSGSQDSPAGVQEYFAYSSGPKAQTLDFSAASENGTMQDISGVAAAGMESRQVRCDSVIAVTGQKVEMNSSRVLQTQALLQIPGISGTLSFDAAGPVLTLANHLPTAINDAVIYANRQAYPIGKLETGVNTRSAGHGLPPGKFTAGAVSDRVDVLRNDLLNAMVPSSGATKFVDRVPLLIGYMASSPIEPLKRDGMIGGGFCLVTWPLDFAPSKSGKVLVPGGFLGVTYSCTGTPIYNPLTEKFTQTMAESELLVVIRPPKGLEKLDSSSLSLALNIRALQYRLTVNGLNVANLPQTSVTTAGGGNASELQDAQRTMIKSMDNPAGLITLTIPGAERFRTAGGAYAISLKVERMDKSVDASENVVEWQLENLDVSLEGTNP